MMQPEASYDPTVGFVISEIERQGLTQANVCRLAGLSPNVLTLWRRHGKEPRIGNIRAVLNLLGYDLAIIRRAPASSAHAPNTAMPTEMYELTADTPGR